jgi:hypothetical protein
MQSTRAESSGSIQLVEFAVEDLHVFVTENPSLKILIYPLFRDARK